MVDSDSDEFESADEEIEEKKQKDAVKAKSDKSIKIEDTKVITPITHSSNFTVNERVLPTENEAKVETLMSGWRTWGAFNVINNASKKVASITTHVSQSISTAIDSINIPDPEEMARIHIDQAKVLNESKEDDLISEKNSVENSRDVGFKFDSLLTGVSQISTKVVAGGLDTLEGIGKKTINILQETDPNIKSKIRNINVGNKPNLSDLLREAKGRQDTQPQINNKNIKTVSFDILLDEYNGQVFLEALEILSNQAQMKIELLLKPLIDDSMRSEIEETLCEIKELCEFDSDNFDEDLSGENLESKLVISIADLKVKINFHDIVNYSKEVDDWFGDNTNHITTSVIFEKAIEVLAKTCSLSLNTLQKLAELLLSQEYRTTADEADALIQLSIIYCSLFNYFATKFSQKLTDNIQNNNETKKITTSLFLECSNAISYIKRAFLLFIPILQIGAV